MGGQGGRKQYGFIFAFRLPPRGVTVSLAMTGPSPAPPVPEARAPPNQLALELTAMPGLRRL